MIEVNCAQLAVLHSVRPAPLSFEAGTSPHDKEDLDRFERFWLLSSLPLMYVGPYLKPIRNSMMDYFKTTILNYDEFQNILGIKKPPHDKRSTTYRSVEV